MKRRNFLILSASAALAPLSAMGEPTHYLPGLVDQALADGKTVFLDFKASWCGTCKTQERVMEALKAENPAYEEAVTFFMVDWDAYRNAAITFDLNIPRRSTLVVLKGDQELGRIVAGTARDEIKALMDVALAAATGS